MEYLLYASATEECNLDKKFEQKKGKECTECEASISPQWRKGPAGSQTLCNACGLRYYRKNKSIKIAKKKIAKSPSPKSKNGHVNITRLPSPPSPADSPSSPPSMNYDKINSNSNMENESAGVLANISSSIPSHPFLFTHKLYSQFNNQIFNQSEPMKFPNLSNSSDILNFNINISTEGTYHSKCNFPSYPNSNSISLPISIDKLVN